jgi:hypothetical protein
MSSKGFRMFVRCRWVSTVALLAAATTPTPWHLNKETSSNKCWIQKNDEAPMGSTISEHETRKAACQAAQDRYDETFSDQAKCWLYGLGTIDRCKKEGVPLPKKP